MTKDTRRRTTKEASGIATAALTPSVAETWQEVRTSFENFCLSRGDFAFIHSMNRPTHPLPTLLSKTKISATLGAPLQSRDSARLGKIVARWRRLWRMKTPS